MERFIFDVDGTLTPSRQTIDSDFAVFFKNFCIENHVYLITGSDKQKTIEQVGEQIYNLAKRVYNCSGSDVWERDQNIRRDNWIIPKRASEFLKSCLKESKFDLANEILEVLKDCNCEEYNIIKEKLVKN